MLSGAALTALAFAPALAAHAQTAPSSNAIQEVVVTATKTGATNLQKTAIAVDVVSGQDLSRDNIKNIKDLSQAAPSLVVTQNNVNPQFYIRGVGGFQGGESEVSMYLDGVYLSRVSVVLQTDFNDLERVEVVEGPQGTLFGRNSTGGAINFISKAPSDHFTFSDTLQVGNYSELDDAASISGPIADNMQASLSVSHVQHNGYLHNIDPGVGDIDAANRTAVRGQLKWEPTADITNTLRADYFYTNENWATNDNLIYPTTYSPLANTIVNNFHEVDVNSIPHNNELGYGLNDEINWKVNDHLSLKSLSALRTDDSYNFQDGDVSDLNAQYGYTQYSEYQVSQEFDLVNNYGPLSGVVGLYYFDEHVRQIGNTYFPGGNVKIPVVTNGYEVFQNTLQPTISRAAFFQEKYQILPTVGITLGGRYTEEHKTLNTYNTNLNYAPGYAINGTTQTAPPGYVYPFIADLNQNSHAFTPKVEVDWQATSNAFTYASVSNGYKSGGFSNTARAVLGAAFNPENLWAYEIGAKTDWLDHTLRINVAGFHYLWSGQQFNALIAPAVSVTANAGGSSLNGFEANVIAKPAEGLTLTGNVTVLSTEYTSFPNYAFPGALKPFVSTMPGYNATGPNAGTFNAKGKELIDAPPVALNLTGQKDFDLADGSDLYVRAEYAYTGKIYYDPTNAPISARAAFSLVNASIGYTPPHSHWTVALWGKNLTDTQYSTGFAAASVFAVSVGDPRTYGLRVNYTY
jgi:iron complex outermembrane receptor protein